MTFHLIGIGGAGMSVVADLLMASGYAVSGSDRDESANVERLRAAGATVHVGHAAENVPADSIVVVSSAIKESNPELAIARERGQRVIHRSQALALASGERDFIAVAGAHGKTSTSGMLAVALGAAGLDPSWAIGGSLTMPGADGGHVSGGRLGGGSVLVAEADESDASFLNYRPRVALVTNVEPDHLDHYGSREAFEQAFLDFAHCIVDGGLLVACADNDGSLRLAQAAAAEGIRVWTYGRTPTAVGERHVQLDGHLVDGVPLDLVVAGAHMLLNAAGAWAVGVELGVDPEVMAKSLGWFKGTGRRFELRGEVNGVRVVDDYAHHPTEVAATMGTARDVCDGRVHVLFQPHLYSRTENFAEAFAAALSKADEAIVTAVYAAREVPSDGVEGDAIVAHMPRGRFIEDKVEAAKAIAAGAKPGDLILTMGAGDVTALAPVVLEALK